MTTVRMMSTKSKVAVVALFAIVVVYFVAVRD